MHRKWMRVSLGVLLFTGALEAQQTATSGIVGQVVDTTQADIAGAAVTVTNIGTHAQRTAMTDAQGNFSGPNRQPATYEVRVEKMGFQTAVIGAFDLLIGQIAHPTVTMSFGAISESV